MRRKKVANKLFKTVYECGQVTVLFRVKKNERIWGYKLQIKTKRERERAGKIDVYRFCFMLLQAKHVCGRSVPFPGYVVDKCEYRGEGEG